VREFGKSVVVFFNIDDILESRLDCGTGLYDTAISKPATPPNKEPPDGAITSENKVGGAHILPLGCRRGKQSSNRKKSNKAREGDHSDSDK
jgi:hypothetical protein